MAYSHLEAEITGDWSPLERKLDAADARMRQIARTTYKVRIDLDSQHFGRELGRMMGALRRIGTTQANVELRVNGEPLAVRRLNNVAEATRALGRARREIPEHSGEMSSGWEAAERRRQAVIARTMALEVEAQRTALGLSNSRTGAVGAGPRNLDAAVAAHKSNLQLEADFKQMESLMAQMEQRGARALVPFVNSANDVETAIKRAHTALKGLQAAQGASSSWNPVDGAAKRNALMNARGDAAMEQMRNDIANQMRASGTVGSVIGGPKNINMDILAKQNAQAKALMQTEARAQKQALKWLEDTNRAAAKSQASLDKINTRKAQQELAALMAEAQRVNKAVDMIRNSRNPGKLTDLMAQITGADGKGGMGGKQALESARKGIRDIADEARTSTSWLTKMRLTIMAFATGYLVIQGLGAAFRALTYVLVGYNSMLETSKIAFTNLLDGSAVAADNLLAKLQSLARTTPFEFKDLVPLTQKLVALGVVAKDKVQDLAVPAIKAIGGAVARMGGGAVEIERIVRALGQMALKGKASAEEVTSQLGELVPAAKYLADAMGVPVAKVFELMKKGMIDGKQAVGAILYGMQKDSGDALAKLSDTWAGAWSNIKDSATDVAASGLRPLFIAMSKLARDVAKVANTEVFRKWAGEKIETLVKWIRILGAVIAWIYTQVSNKMPYIIGILLMLGSQKVLTGVLSLSRYLMTLSGAALATQLALAKLAVYVLVFVAAYRKFEYVRNVTDVTIWAVLTSFKAFAHGWGWLIGQIGGGIEKLGDLFGWFKRIPAGVMEALQIASPGTAGLISWLAEASDGLKEFGQSWQNMEVDSDKMFDEWINGFLVTGSKKFRNFMQQGIGAPEDIRNMVSAAMAEAEKGIKDGLAKLPKVAVVPGKGTGADEKARNAALRLEKDRLRDTAAMYDLIAKNAEDSAKRQIAAIKSVTEKLQDIFGGAQEDLLKLGITNNPLDAIIDRFEKLAGLGDKLKAVANGTKAIAAAARLHAQHARMSLDKANGGDGRVPQGDVALGNVITSGKAAGSIMIDNIVKEFNSKAPRELGASCAWVASQALNKLGHSLKTSANAGQLERNAKAAGWVLVPLGTAGALHVQSGKGFGKVSGHHTTVGIGNGRVAGSSEYRYQEFDIRRARGNPRAYLPANATTAAAGRSVIGPKVPGYMPKDNADTLAGLFGNESGGPLDLSLQRITALPKAWGSAVLESADSTQRFRVQTLLANRELQEMLRAVYGAKFDSFVSQLRATATEIDEIINKAVSAKAAVAALRDLDTQARMRGKDNDPFTALEERRRTGGDLAWAKASTFAQIQAKAQRNAIDSLTFSTKEYAKSERDRMRVLSEAAPLINRATVGTYQYDRAVELAGKRFEYWNSAEIKSLARRATALDKDAARSRRWAAAQAALVPGIDSKDTARAKDAEKQAQGIRKSMNEGAAARAKIDATAYDFAAAEKRRQSFEQLTGDLDRETARLKAHAETVRDTTLTETGLNAELERQANYYQQLDRLLGEGHEEPRAKQLANQLSLTQAHNAALSRQIELQREIVGIEAQTAANAALGATKRGIMASTDAGSVNQARQLANADKNAGLMEQIRTGKLKNIADIARLRVANETDVNEQIENEIAGNASQARLAARNSLIDANLQLTLRRLETEYKLTDSMRQQLEFEAEVQKRKGTTNEVTQEEIEASGKLQGILTRIASLDYTVTMGDLKDQLDALLIPAGKLRDDFLRMRELQKNPNLSGAERVDILNTEQIIRDSRETQDAIREAWQMMGTGIGDGLEAVRNATGGFFDHIKAGAHGMVESVSESLAKMSRQILQNYLLQKILGFTGLGKYMGAITAAANANPFESGTGTVGIGPVSNGDNYNPSAAATSSTRNYMMPRSAMVGNTSMYEGANITVVLPNVKNGEDAKDVGKAIHDQVSSGRQSNDSRLSSAQNVADLGNVGNDKR